MIRLFCHSAFLLLLSGLSVTAQVPSGYEFSMNEGMQVFVRDGKWGCRDPLGNEACPGMFSFPASAEMCVDRENDREYLTVHSGPAGKGRAWNYQPWFQEGLAIVYRRGKYGYADRKGREVIPCMYDEAYPFSGGAAVVTIHGSKWEFDYMGDRPVSPGEQSFVIDKTGKRISAVYDRVALAFDDFDNLGRHFKDGLAAVKRNGKWGFINQAGREIISCRYDEVWNAFTNGITAVYNGYNGSIYRGGLLGYVHRNGKTVIPCSIPVDWEWEYPEFSNGILRIDPYWYDGIHTVYDTTGKKVKVSDRDEILGYYSDDMIPVVVRVDNERKVGFRNKNGKVVVPCIYDDADYFSEGVAAVKRGGKWGFINRTGNETVPCIYETVRFFHKGMAAVKRDGKWGYINQSGRELIPCIYDRVGFLHEGMIDVSRAGQHGFTDETGWEIIPCAYGEVMPFVDGKAKVKYNGEWEIFNINDTIPRAVRQDIQKLETIRALPVSSLIKPETENSESFKNNHSSFINFFYHGQTSQ